MCVCLCLFFCFCERWGHAEVAKCEPDANFSAKRDLNQLISLEQPSQRLRNGIASQEAGNLHGSN